MLVGKNTPCSGMFGKSNSEYNFRDWDFLFMYSAGCFTLAAASSAQRAGFSPEGTRISVGISLLLCPEFPRFQTPLLTVVNVLERELGWLCPRLAESLAVPALGGRGRLASPPEGRYPSCSAEQLRSCNSLLQTVPGIPLLFLSCLGSLG